MSGNQWRLLMSCEASFLRGVKMLVVVSVDVIVVIVNLNWYVLVLVLVLVSWDLAFILVQQQHKLSGSVLHAFS